MKLRNGKTYSTKIDKKKKIDKIKTLNLKEIEYKKCCICCADYNNFDIIACCSCELKHHFHEKCLLKSFKLSKEFCQNPITYVNECPYCRKKIDKKYYKFKIIKKDTI